MSPEDRRRMRFEQVERFLSSGMRVSEWCALNKVSESVLYAWMARYRGSELEADIDSAQKCKRTSGWIALSRQDIAAATGLARVETAAPVADGTAASGLDAGDAAPRASIGITVNGVSIDVPPGADPLDIAHVLHAVGAL